MGKKNYNFGSGSHKIIEKQKSKNDLNPLLLLFFLRFNKLIGILVPCMQNLF